jgi:hypothetical protein
MTGPVQRPPFAFCLPSEVEELSRRELLRTGVSLTAYVSVAGLLGGRAYGQSATGTGTSTGTDNYPPQRKLVWINMAGGWDILETTDPKPQSTANVDMIYDFGLASPVTGASDGAKIGRWMPNIAAAGSNLLVIRGMSMGTTSHPAGSTYMDTAVLSNSGMVNAASIPAIVASESTATIPIIQLAGGNNPAIDRGLLKPVSAVRAGNLDLYRSMYPTDDAAIQRRMAVLDYLKGSVARVQSAVGTSDRVDALAAAEEKVRGQFQANVGAKLALTDADRAPFAGAPKGMDQGATDAVALALKLINNDIVTCVNLGFGGFDTHQNQTARLQPILTAADFAIGKLVQGLQASGKLDSTLIVLFSDFGRTPKVNGGNGRDHWPTGGAMMIGGGIDGGRAFGATTDDTLSAVDLIDPATGHPTTDSATGVQLNPTHLGGAVLALTLGSAYLTYRPYMSALPGMIRLKGG